MNCEDGSEGRKINILVEAKPLSCVKMLTKITAITTILSNLVLKGRSDDTIIKRLPPTYTNGNINNSINW